MKIYICYEDYRLYEDAKRILEEKKEEVVSTLGEADFILFLDYFGKKVLAFLDKIDRRAKYFPYLYISAAELYQEDLIPKMYAMAKLYDDEEEEGGFIF